MPTTQSPRSLVKVNAPATRSARQSSSVINLTDEKEKPNPKKGPEKIEPLNSNRRTQTEPQNSEKGLNQSSDVRISRRSRVQSEIRIDVESSDDTDDVIEIIPVDDLKTVKSAKSTQKKTNKSKHKNTKDTVLDGNDVNVDGRDDIEELLSVKLGPFEGLCKQLITLFSKNKHTFQFGLNFQKNDQKNNLPKIGKNKTTQINNPLTFTAHLSIDNYKNKSYYQYPYDDDLIEPLFLSIENSQQNLLNSQQSHLQNPQNKHSTKTTIPDSIPQPTTLALPHSLHFPPIPTDVFKFDSFIHPRSIIQLPIDVNGHIIYPITQQFECSQHLAKLEKKFDKIESSVIDLTVSDQISPLISDTSSQTHTRLPFILPVSAHSLLPLKPLQDNRALIYERYFSKKDNENNNQPNNNDYFIPDLDPTSLPQPFLWIELELLISLAHIHIESWLSTKNTNQQIEKKLRKNSSQNVEQKNPTTKTIFGSEIPPLISDLIPDDKKVELFTAISNSITAQLKKIYHTLPLNYTSTSHKNSHKNCPKNYEKKFSQFSSSFSTQNGHIFDPNFPLLYSSEKCTLPIPDDSSPYDDINHNRFFSIPKAETNIQNNNRTKSVQDDPFIFTNQTIPQNNNQNQVPQFIHPLFKLRDMSVPRDPWDYIHAYEYIAQVCEYMFDYLEEKNFDNSFLGDENGLKNNKQAEKKPFQLVSLFQIFYFYRFFTYRSFFPSYHHLTTYYNLFKEEFNQLTRSINDITTNHNPAVDKSGFASKNGSKNIPKKPPVNKTPPTTLHTPLKPTTSRTYTQSLELDNETDHDDEDQLQSQRLSHRVLQNELNAKNMTKNPLPGQKDDLSSFPHESFISPTKSTTSVKPFGRSSMSRRGKHRISFENSPQPLDFVKLDPLGSSPILNSSLNQMVEGGIDINSPLGPIRSPFRVAAEKLETLKAARLYSSSPGLTIQIEKNDDDAAYELMVNQDKNFPNESKKDVYSRNDGIGMGSNFGQNFGKNEDKTSHVIFESEIEHKSDDNDMTDDTSDESEEDYDDIFGIIPKPAPLRELSKPTMRKNKSQWEKYQKSQKNQKNQKNNENVELNNFNHFNKSNFSQPVPVQSPSSPQKPAPFFTNNDDENLCGDLPIVFIANIILTDLQRKEFLFDVVQNGSNFRNEKNQNNSNISENINFTFFHPILQHLQFTLTKLYSSLQTTDRKPLCSYVDNDYFDSILSKADTMSSFESLLQFAQNLEINNNNNNNNSEQNLSQTNNSIEIVPPLSLPSNHGSISSLLPQPLTQKSSSYSTISQNVTELSPLRINDLISLHSQYQFNLKNYKHFLSCYKKWNKKQKIEKKLKNNNNTNFIEQNDPNNINIANNHIIDVSAQNLEDIPISMDDDSINEFLNTKYTTIQLELFFKKPSFHFDEFKSSLAAALQTFLSKNFLTSSPLTGPDLLNSFCDISTLTWGKALRYLYTLPNDNLLIYLSYCKEAQKGLQSQLQFQTAQHHKSQNIDGFDNNNATTSNSNTAFPADSKLLYGSPAYKRYIKAEFVSLGDHDHVHTGAFIDLDSTAFGQKKKRPKWVKSAPKPLHLNPPSPFQPKTPQRSTRSRGFVAIDDNFIDKFNCSPDAANWEKNNGKKNGKNTTGANVESGDNKGLYTSIVKNSLSSSLESASSFDDDDGDDDDGDKIEKRKKNFDNLNNYNNNLYTDDQQPCLTVSTDHLPITPTSPHVIHNVLKRFSAMGSSEKLSTPMNSLSSSVQSIANLTAANIGRLLTPNKFNTSGKFYSGADSIKTIKSGAESQQGSNHLRLNLNSSKDRIEPMMSDSLDQNLGSNTSKLLTTNHSDKKISSFEALLPVSQLGQDNNHDKVIDTQILDSLGSSYGVNSLEQDIICGEHVQNAIIKAKSAPIIITPSSNRFSTPHTFIASHSGSTGQGNAQTPNVLKSNFLKNFTRNNHHNNGTKSLLGKNSMLNPVLKRGNLLTPLTKDSGLISNRSNRTPVTHKAFFPLASSHNSQNSVPNFTQRSSQDSVHNHSTAQSPNFHESPNFGFNSQVIDLPIAPTQDVHSIVKTDTEHGQDQQDRDREAMQE